MGHHMNNLSFQGRWPEKKGKNTHINILELNTVWKACQWFEESIRGTTVSLQIDNTTTVAYLLKYGGTHCKTLNGLVRKILLKCHENQIMVFQEYLRGVVNLHAAIKGQESSGAELRGPSLSQVIQAWGNSNCRSVCKQLGTQGASILQPGSQRQENIWGRCLERRMTGMPQICLPTSKHHPDGHGQASKKGRGPDHDHTLLARSELVPRMSLTAHQKEQSRTTSRCLNSGVLSAIKRGYQFWKFV